MSNRKSEFVDVGAKLRFYASKWYWFLLSVVACCALGFLYSRTVEPKFVVRANIMFTDDNTGGMLAAGLGDMGALFGGNSSAEDEAMIVSSHTTYREVARNLGLNRVHMVRTMPMHYVFAYKEFPVDVIPDPSINPDTLRTTVSFKVKVSKSGKADILVKARKKTLADLEDVELPKVVTTPYGSFTVKATPDLPADETVKTVVLFTGFDNAAEDLAEDVSIGLASKRSSIIQMEMVTHDVDYAKDVLNNIIAQYNDAGVEEQNAKNSKTASFIADRLVLLLDSLVETEQELEAYKERQGVIDLVADGQYNFSRLGELDKVYTESTVRRQNLSNIIDLLQASGSGDYAIIPVEGAETLARMIEEYNSLVAERMRIGRSAKPGNETLDLLDSRIGQYRDNILKSLGGALAEAREREARYGELYNATLDRIGSMPTQERDLRDLMRQQKIKEETYLFLLQKQEETAILLANATPKGQIIDAAYSLNEDISISTKMILAMAFVFGMLLPPCGFFMVRLLRTKFNTKAEVEERVDVPVLGEVCTDRSGQSLVVRPGGSGSTAELFRLIRVNLQFILGSSDEKVVLMTSTKSGEGKSFISINMAASMAMLGKKTLLIGMDIRKPRLAQYLKISAPHGLTEYLASPSMAIADIIMPDALMPNLDVIVAGPIPPNPSEMLASERVDDLFAKLRGMYDYIIVDSAPVGMVSDTFLLARVSDATIYVTRADYTTFADLRFAESIYDEKRLPKLSLVVNGTQAKKGYGYGYGENVKNK
ncbi:MAG: polysaccharide biosynthesis tyrosine autokinase [Muribaculaceae bacterium]|nr:polysaccharide biosynthesis tyrosine autokinase [Muribaculaceae bacterium]